MIREEFLKELKKVPYARDGLVPTLISTDQTKRGVFMGWIKPEDYDQEHLVAKDVQMAVYWSSDTKGFLGLAAIGPQKGSRITKPSKLMSIQGCISWTLLTPEAVKQWEKNLWD